MRLFSRRRKESPPIALLERSNPVAQRSNPLELKFLRHGLVFNLAIILSYSRHILAIESPLPDNSRG